MQTTDTDQMPATYEEIQALRNDGYFIRQRFFSDEEIDDLEEVADAAVAWRNEHFESYQDQFARISTRNSFVFVNELADDSESRGDIQHFCLQPAIRDMARSLAGPDVAHCCYQLVYKFAGHDRPFAWHQDEIQTPADPPFFNIWIALNDMDEANGCLWTIPGLGMDRVLPHVQTAEGLSAWPLDDPNQGIPLRMQRGDICVMGSKSLHKSGANTSDRPRKAMLIIMMDRNAKVHGHPVPTVDYD